MFPAEKNKSYGSIFVYCFVCFVLVVEVTGFAKKPYNNRQNLLMKTEAMVEEGFLDSGILPSGSDSVRAKDQQKLSLQIRQDRIRPPNTYCVKFESFVKMSKLVKTNGDKYESRPFSVGGYNWTLLIYPNANIPAGSGGYVSMYVRIDNSSLINTHKEVYAEITFLAFKTSTDKWQILQESEAQRFTLAKQQWGQLTFLSTAYFLYPGYGYIDNGGKAVFGVDISIVKPYENWENFSSEENIADPLLRWTLTKFSIRYNDSYTSDTFSSGGRNWLLKVYPNGVGSATGVSLSLYLLSASNEKGYVAAKFRVINQNRAKNVEKQVEGWPYARENGWGLDSLIPLADLNDASKGFIFNDSLKLEVHLLSFSKTDSFSLDN